MRKQIRLLLMLALPMLLGLASCAEHDNPDPNPLAKQVSGMWWSLADQEGTYKDATDSYPYTRMGQAICFNEDGTGYGVTFFFDDDNSDPIAIIGGKDMAPFTYTSTADGRLSLDFTDAYKDYADYFKKWTMTYASEAVTATNGTVTLTLEKPSDQMAETIRDWDEQFNGGAAIGGSGFNPNDEDFTFDNWRNEPGIYLYDGTGEYTITKKGRTCKFSLVPLPWYEGTKLTNLPDGFCDDITPQNGWELALNLCGNTEGSIKNNNFFALYNKYLGILRFFYYMPEGFTSGNDHVWQVSMSDNLAQHSLYGYGVPSDRTVTNKAVIGQTGSETYMEYVTPWVDYQSNDGLIVPNAGWWAFDVDLSMYRANANHDTKSNIKLQMRSWDKHTTSLYSAMTANIDGTLKASLKLDAVAKKSSSTAKGVMMGLQATAQAGSSIANFYSGNWAGGLTSLGQMFGTGASLAGLGGDGGGGSNYKLDGTISLGMSGDINTSGVIDGSKTITGIPSPTFSLSDFDLKNSHVAQGVWNLKTTPKVYRMDYVAYDYANTYHQKDYFLNRPYFFDPSSIEVELNPDVFPESQIEWMEVDAICGASADKQYRPKDDALHLTGNAALRDAYGVVTPAPEGYGGPSDVTNKFVKDKKTCLWDFLYNMNDKHGMDELYTILDLSTIYISKLQGRGKNGFAIEPQIAGGYLQDGYYYIQYPFLEVNVKVKVKMRGMENPIVLSRNYLPDIVDYGDGSDFDDSRRHSRPYQSKMSGHTDLYDYQMKRIDDILKLYRTPTVGDLYYSDGTYSKTLEPGKTPIGVIAYVGAPTDADNDIVEYYQGGAGHGLVLCLKNAANRVKWSTEKVSKLSWKLTDLAGLMRIENVVSGYSNTAKLAADAAKYPAAAAAKNYKELPAPAGTTGWFLPSAQQWVRMIMSLGGLDESKIEWRNTFGYWEGAIDKWENALKKAGSGKYDSMNDGNYTFWSSSECSAEEALMLDIWVTQSPGFIFMPTTKGTAYDNTRVRPILAF